MTLAEFHRWSLQRGWGVAPQDRLRALPGKVRSLARESCLIWADVTFEAASKGRPIQTADAWIAASAVHYQVPLITNNAADYAMISRLQVLTVT